MSKVFGKEEETLKYINDLPMKSEALEFVKGQIHFNLGNLQKALDIFKSNKSNTNTDPDSHKLSRSPVVSTSFPSPLSPLPSLF